VYWLPLAAAPDVHRQLPLPKIYDVGFVGNIARAHRNTPRARRLKLIAEHFQTNDFYRTYTPEEVGRVYSQSHIVFNTSIAGDVTMRVFEGAACGAMVITDSVANGLGELFEIGREIVAYTDDADLLNKITYYLAHEAEQEQIACAGHQRAQTQHSYIQRTQTILEKVAKLSFRRIAPMRQFGQSQRWAARRKVYTHLHMVDAILDEVRDMGANPLACAWAVLPVLVRRLIV
jgi:spore maturation protein CgeB